MIKIPSNVIGLRFIVAAGTGVAVGCTVADAVAICVTVGTMVGVAVSVGIPVGVRVAVGSGVSVSVGVGRGVDVGASVRLRCASAITCALAMMAVARSSPGV